MSIWMEFIITKKLLNLRKLSVKLTTEKVKNYNTRNKNVSKI